MTNNVNDTVTGNENSTINLNENVEDKPKSLSYLQKERYNYLLTFYNSEEAMNLLFKIDKTGPNSWASVQTKLNTLKHSSYAQKEYEDSLYDAFELDEMVTDEKIIQMVTNVRSDMALDSYVNRIKVQCFNDFQNLFIVEKVFSSDAPADKRKKEIGYKPVFRNKSL